MKTKRVWGVLKSHGIKLANKYSSPVKVYVYPTSSKCSCLNTTINVYPQLSPLPKLTDLGRLQAFLGQLKDLFLNIF